MKEIFCISLKGKTYRLTRKSLTFLFNIINEDTLCDRKYYLQISNVDPWFIPKKDKILEGKVTLWGWLFFYIGCDSKMLKKNIE